MSGDVDRNERLIVLAGAAPGAADQAFSAARDAGTGTVHQYGQRVLVADVPPQVEGPVANEVALAPSPGRLVAAVDELARDEVEGLDDQEALGLAAFELRSSDDYALAKAARPHDGEPWAQVAGDVLPPDILDSPERPLGAAGNGEVMAATSSRLTGSVAVGVVIVEGPTADLKFSQAERTKVVAEVQNGLAWLGAQSSPSGIRWVYDIRIITISAQPQAGDDTPGEKEARFRDPALAAMGYGPGLAGAQAYVDALRTSKGTNWAYCAFFTKYPVGHFAYASLGGPRLVMHYANDGWGPDNIDRVFAHETGHIFRAPDEYAASGCDCGGSWGHFNVANRNCENCATGGGVACIMKSNSWAVCDFTPYHLGFPQGARYTGVFVAGSGGHGLWVNASWTPFVQKWQEWSAQGLRLADFSVAHIGNDFRYSGAFRAGTGAYALWAMSDWAGFQQKWQQYSAQGMRLVDIEVTPVGTQNRFSGVFRQGSGGYGLWALADWNSFSAKWQQWSSQGLRLADLSIVMVNGTPRYTGVFEQGTGGYALWTLADWPSFRSKWQQWSSQGLRLVDIERTRIGSETRYSGVFRQGTGAYGLWSGASWASFRSKWQEWSAAGMRLIDVSMDPTGIEAMAAPEAGAPMSDRAGVLEGLLGFGGAPVAMVHTSGREAPGEGVVELGTVAPVEEVDLGDFSLAPAAEVAPFGLAELAPEPTYGNGHVPAGAGVGSGPTHADEPVRSGRAMSSGAGLGEMVMDTPGEDIVPQSTGIGMVHH